MNRRKLPIVAGSLALLAAGPALARIWIQTDGYEDGTTRPVSIALLPPEASVSEQRVIKREALVEESTEFSVMFADALAESLRLQGYQVEIIDADRINTDPSLREAVIDARRRHEEMLVGVKAKEIRRRQYEGSEQARILASYLGVDAIGFATLNVVGAKGGKKAMGILLGGGTGGSSGMLDLVDGVSGHLEARLMNMLSGSGSAKKFEEDPAGEIAEIVEKIVYKMPDAEPSVRLARKSDGEDVLSDIESLLGE